MGHAPNRSALRPPVFPRSEEPAIEPAIDRERHPGDVAGRVARQEHDRAGELLRCPVPAQRHGQRHPPEGVARVSRFPRRPQWGSSVWKRLRWPRRMCAMITPGPSQRSSAIAYQPPTPQFASHTRSATSGNMKRGVLRAAVSFLVCELTS